MTAHRSANAKILPLVVLLCGALTTYCLAQQEADVDDVDVTAEMLELGADVYTEQCRSCHGRDGKGDGPAARFLSPKPRDLTSGEWRHAEGGTIAAIAEVVRSGVDDTGMQPMGELLTDEETLAVAAYVHEVIVGPADEKQ